MRQLPQRIFWTSIVSILIVWVAFAGGYQLNEHGARATGMGGAFVAQASDPSAIFFNPAGLAFQKGLNVMGGATFIFPSTSLKGPGALDLTTEQEAQIYYPPNLYGTYAIDDNWVVGLGIFTPYGLGSEWSTGWVGNMVAVKTSVQTFYFNPTVSYKFNDQISVGAGVSYIYGSVDLSKRIPFGTSINGTLNLEGTGSGFGFNVGVLCKPIENLSLGASYRSFTEIEFSGDAKFTDMGALSSYFPGGSGKAKLPMPMNVIVGAAYEILPSLTIEADAQWIGWSEYKNLEIVLPTGPIYPAYGIPLQKTQTQAKNWDDGYMGRLGAEYKFDRELTLRAGIIYDITGQPASKMEPMLPDADRIDLTLGVGYKIDENLTVDLAYMIVLFQERKSYYFAPAVPTPINMNGTYNSTAHLFGFDVAYKF